MLMIIIIFQIRFVYSRIGSLSSKILKRTRNTTYLFNKKHSGDKFGMGARNPRMPKQRNSNRRGSHGGERGEGAGHRADPRSYRRGYHLASSADVSAKITLSCKQVYLSISQEMAALTGVTLLAGRALRPAARSPW